VRRLFSTFAHGPPGVGLLLMRLAAGVGLVAEAVPALLTGLPLGPALFQVFSISLGILLFAGLWTPVVGALVAVEALWNVFTFGHPWLWIMLATLSAALALIGPGAWSIDARLFGWKRFEIRDPKSQDSPPDE
jgi:putative oxidoreductase